MTEAEAEDKWCPHVRYTSIRGNGINRWVDREDGDEQTSPTPARCIGSRCMMWRWHLETFTPPGGSPFATHKPLRPTKDGYCGLAGQDLKP